MPPGREVSRRLLPPRHRSARRFSRADEISRVGPGLRRDDLEEMTVSIRRSVPTRRRSPARGLPLDMSRHLKEETDDHRQPDPDRHSRP
jgi:hypothetical protein